MILTEEELNKLVSSISKGGIAEKVNKIVASHRLLLSANAELSFKNMKYKQALEHICEVEMDSTEFEKEVMFNIARDILKEELK